MPSITVDRITTRSPAGTRAITDLHGTVTSPGLTAAGVWIRRTT